MRSQKRFSIFSLICILIYIAISNSALAADKNCATEECDLLDFATYLAGKASTAAGVAKGVSDAIDLLFGVNEIDELREYFIDEMEEMRDEEWVRSVEGLMIEYVLIKDNYTTTGAENWRRDATAAIGQLEGIIRNEESPWSVYSVAESYNILVPMTISMLAQLGHSENAIKYIYARSIQTNERIVGQGVYSEDLFLVEPGNGNEESLAMPQNDIFRFDDFPYLPLYQGSSLLNRCLLVSRNGENRDCGDLGSEKIFNVKSKLRKTMEIALRYILDDYDHTWFKIQSYGDPSKCLSEAGPGDKFLQYGTCSATDNMLWRLDFGPYPYMSSGPSAKICSISGLCIARNENSGLYLTDASYGSYNFEIIPPQVSPDGKFIEIRMNDQLLSTCYNTSDIELISTYWHQCKDGSQPTNDKWTLADKVVRRPPQADLTGTITGPAIIFPGQNLNVAFEVTNIGDAPASGYEVEVLLSKTPEWTDERLSYSDTYRDDVLLLGGRFTKTSALQLGDIYTTQFQTLIPSDTPAGQYYIGLSIDWKDIVPEKNESNNRVCHLINVADNSILPDLSAIIEAPQTVFPGQILTNDDIHIEIINAGGATLNSDSTFSGYNIDLVLSEDSQLPYHLAKYSTTYSDDVLLLGCRWYLDNEPAGGNSRVLSVNTQIPFDTPPGPVCLGVNIDPGFQIFESNRTNNAICKWVKVSNGTTISSGEPILDSIKKDEWHWYRIVTLESDKMIHAQLDTIKGDADLYMMVGQAPSYNEFDCRPYLGGITAETCDLSVIGASIGYIGIHGYDEAVYKLEATISETNSLHFNETFSGNVELGEWLYFTIDTPPRSANYLIVDLFELSNDLDLYLQKGSIPTFQNHRCRPYRGISTSEACIINLENSNDAPWFVGVHGYAAGSFNLQAIVQ